HRRRSPSRHAPDAGPGAAVGPPRCRLAEAMAGGRHIAHAAIALGSNKQMLACNDAEAGRNNVETLRPLRRDLRRWPRWSTSPPVQGLSGKALARGVRGLGGELRRPLG